MLATFILTALCAFGFGRPFRTLGLGASAAVGAFCIPLTMFCLVTLLGLSVSVSSWMCLGMAIACGVLGQCWPSPCAKVDVSAVSHPVFTLTLGVGILIAIAAPDRPYIPHNFDEMSGWGTWMKQILATDTWYTPDMLSEYPFYPKAWPLSVAFVSNLIGKFDGSHAVAVQALIHVSILGALFDIARNTMHNKGVSWQLSTATSWCIVLALALLQAMWLLAPPSLLIERPFIYAGVGLFCVAMGRDSTETNTPSYLRAIAAGLLSASAIVIKTPAIALVPTGALLLFMQPMLPSRRLKQVTLFLVFPAATLLLWAIASVEPPPSPAFSGDLPAKITLLKKIIWDSAVFVSQFKLALSIGAVLGLILTTRLDFVWRWVPLAFAVFLIVYFVGLIVLYLGIFHSPPTGDLPSLSRYLRVPIRVLHALGLTALFTWVTITAVRCLPALSSSKAFLRFTYGITAGMAFFLVMGVQFTISDLPFKSREDQNNIALITEMRDQTAQLAKVLSDRGRQSARVIMIAQGDNGLLQVAANYYSTAAIGDGHAHRLYLHRFWSWGPNRADLWTNPIAPGELLEIFKGFDVVWPVVVDDWSLRILASMTGSEACSANPSEFFFFRDPTTLTGFQCVSKRPRINNGQRQHAD